MAEIKTAIVPLTGANYPTWKVQCKMSLIKDGLWGVIKANETAPEKNDGAAPSSSFKKLCPGYYYFVHQSISTLFNW